MVALSISSDNGFTAGTSGDRKGSETQVNAAIGLQTYSVRDEWDKDILGTLERLRDIGYENLELAVTNEGGEIRTGGLGAGELKKALDRLGMKAVSTHVYPLGDDNWDSILAFNEEVGSAAVIYPIHFFASREDVLDLSAKMNKWGELCRKSGLSFYFHNHYHEFQNIGDESIMDMLLTHTDPDTVKIELDTYWALRGGVDPVGLLRRLGKRCDLVHQKDLPRTTRPVNMLELFAPGEEITEEKFGQVWKAEDFAEIGDGGMNIPSILAEIRALGFAKYVFVEQDMTAMPPLDSVERSFRNLSRLWNEGTEGGSNG